MEFILYFNFHNLFTISKFANKEILYLNLSLLLLLNILLDLQFFLYFVYRSDYLFL